ncbi:type III-B CRISPR module RAMP protein Cmr1 [Anaerostipes caccae]|uniref:type III-B CRISPR module RAMP protein Cmr1 n=1 Tax=Anaerostipes caccae TaxID=105841 RepID=UPI00101DF98B|nr:type III-B CRISPR module RAMP protein Cmr1 [Anaerostipes caccae]
MAILKKRIKLELITAMGTHGANNKELEFRITELKSAMRFWWRAVQCFDSAEELYRKESALFGSLGRKAPVSIRQYKFDRPNAQSIKLGKGGTVDFFEEGEVIEIELLSHDSEKLDKYLQILKLTSYLGGIGQRSRKGYGAFKIVESNGTAPKEKEIVEILEQLIISITGEDHIKQLNKEQNIIFNCNDSKYLCLNKIRIGRERELKKFYKDVKKCIHETANTKEYLLSVSCYGSENSKVKPIVSEFRVKRYNNFVKNYCQTYIKYLIKG